LNSAFSALRIFTNENRVYFGILACILRLTKKISGYCIDFMSGIFIEWKVFLKQGSLKNLILGLPPQWVVKRGNNAG